MAGSDALATLSEREQCRLLQKNLAREELMQRAFTFVVMSALLLVTGLFAGDAFAQQKTLKDQLVGTWTFLSGTGKLADGSPAWGANPSGLLIFADNGRYSSIIVRSDLPKLASKNRLQGTPDENKAAVHGSIGSFGTYTVDETKKSFTVKFEGSTYANLAGTAQTGPVVISGDELKITNPASTYGGQTELTYKRAK